MVRQEAASRGFCFAVRKFVSQVDMVGNLFRNFSKLIRVTIEGAGWVAAVAILLILFSTMCDITGRYLFDKPILGTIEFCDQCLAIVISMGFSFAQLRKRQIRVDFVLDLMKPKLVKILDGVTLLVSVALVVLLTVGSFIPIAYQMTLRQAYVAGAINFPIWPGYIALALGGILWFIQLLIDWVEGLQRPAAPLQKEESE